MTHPLAVKKGMSRSRDPEEAAAELHRALNDAQLRLVVFYCPSDYDLPALACAIKTRFGDANVVGCTTAGEITPQGYLDGAVTGFSLSGDDIEAVSQLIPLDPFDSEACSTQVQTLLTRVTGAGNNAPSAENAFAFLLIDGLSMQEEMVVSCMHQGLHGIDLIGGSAADDTRFQATHLYSGGQFHRNVALLILVRTALPFMAFRTQHFVESDKRMVVTRADPGRRIVSEINGKPAAKEFARLVGLDVTELTPMIFSTHPVVVRVGGQYFVRSIAKVNADDSLTFFCAIDEGIVLRIAQGVDMVENLQQAFADVHATIGQPQLVLGCDCILRRLESEREGIKDDIGRIFADNNVIGFATYGEQFNAMHLNQTFTGIAIGKAA